MRTPVLPVGPPNGTVETMAADATPGRSLELVERGLIQGDDVSLVRIFRGGEGKLKSERARRIESGIDAQQMQKGLGEERGGDDQDKGGARFSEDEQRVA